MKVVFDTNVFVSAPTLPDGRGDQALRRIVEGEDSFALSKQILDELLSALARKLARVAVFLSNLGEIVEPAESLTVLADEPDNRIVECALAANAQLIVTGDRAMPALGEYQGIRIISLSAYPG